MKKRVGFFLCLILMSHLLCLPLYARQAYTYNVIAVDASESSLTVWRLTDGQLYYVRYGANSQVIYDGTAVERGQIRPGQSLSISFVYDDAMAFDRYPSTITAGTIKINGYAASGPREQANTAYNQFLAAPTTIYYKENYTVNSASREVAKTVGAIFDAWKELNAFPQDTMVTAYSLTAPEPEQAEAQYETVGGRTVVRMPSQETQLNALTAAMEIRLSENARNYLNKKQTTDRDLLLYSLAKTYIDAEPPYGNVNVTIYTGDAQVYYNEFGRI